MKQSLNVLLVEDRETDAELLEVELRLAGFDPSIKRVETEVGLATNLDPAPDIILADYTLPQFDALRALQVLHQSQLDIPCIIVSGSISEDQAIECLKQGASDYLLKDRLTRLGASVRAALANKKLRDEQLAALKTLQYQSYLLANVSDAIIATDAALNITSWNRGAETLLGWQAHEVIGKPITQILQLQNPTHTLAEMRQAVISTGEWIGEISTRHKNGTALITDTTIHDLQDEHGNPLGAVSVSRDVTAAKRAQDALRRNEEYYRSLIENISDIIAVVDSTNIFRYLSPSFERATGFTTSDWMGKNAFEIVHPDDLARAQELFGFLLRGAFETSIFDLQIRHCTGSWLYMETLGRSIVDESGQTLAVLNLRDVSERKHIDSQLRRSEAELKQAQAISHVGSWVWDIPHDRYELSDEMYRIFDLSPETFTGKFEQIARSIHPDDRALVNPVFQAVKQENLTPLEFRLLLPDQSIRTVRVQPGELIKNAQGKNLHLNGIVQDITDHKQHEHELEVIATISSALRAATLRSEIPPVLLGELMGLFQANATALMTFDPQTQEFYYEFARGEWEPLIGQRIPPGQGIVSQVAKTRQPYLTNDVRNDPLFYRKDQIGKLKAYMCAPLIVLGETIGVLEIGRATTVQDEEAQLLVAIADIAATALNRAALHDQTEQRLEQLTALRTIDRAINASLDLKIILTVLLDQVILQLHADATDILLYNPALQALEYSAGRGFRTRAAERALVRIGVGYAGRALYENRTISVTDLTNSDNLARGTSFTQEGFVACHAVPLFIKGKPKGVLEVFQRTPRTPDADWLGFLESLASQAAIALDNAQLFDELQRSNANLALAYDATIEGWSRALDLRDRETEGHTQRVTNMTLRLAQVLRINGNDLVQIRRGALLHDIGKMGVPDSILRKPGPLTPEEWSVMRAHPIHAYDLIAPIEYLRPAIDIPYCHHEKWDGSGYPRKLHGEQIPLAARLFAVVDVWDALHSDRPYRPAWQDDRILEYILAEQGKHFDPRIVEAFSRILGEN